MHAQYTLNSLYNHKILFWFENILFSVNSRVSRVSECLQQDKRGFVPANLHTTREWHHSCECDCGESGLNPYGVCVCVRECDSVVWSHTSVGIRFSFLLAIHFHTLFSSRTSITLWRWHEPLTGFKQTHKNSMCKICVKTISVNMYLLLSDIESIH